MMTGVKKNLNLKKILRMNVKAILMLVNSLKITISNLKLAKDIVV